MEPTSPHIIGTIAFVCYALTDLFLEVARALWHLEAVTGLLSTFWTGGGGGGHRLVPRTRTAPIPVFEHATASRSAYLRRVYPFVKNPLIADGQ